MRINLREGSLEAVRTESGASLLRFRLITAYDEQKLADARTAAQKARDVAAERVAKLAEYNAADSEQTTRLASILERAEAELDRLWHTQPSEHYFCLEGRQVNAAIQMLRGKFESPVGEVGLADGYRHIRFHPDGLRIFGDSESECTINFPGMVLADAIEAVCDNLETLIKFNIPQSVNPSHPTGKALSFNTTLELTRDFMRDLEKGYAPWVEWAYTDYEGIDNYPPMWRKISEDRLDPHVSDNTLTQTLEILEHAAESYSDGKVGDGKPTLIHLSYQCHPGNTPMSYYFWIENAKGQRCMNGGVDAHQKYTQNGTERLQEWGYRTNT